jgi:hypothetical protein
VNSREKKEKKKKKSNLVHDAEEEADFRFLKARPLDAFEGLPQKHLPLYAYLDLPIERSCCTRGPTKQCCSHHSAKAHFLVSSQDSGPSQ